MAYKFEDKLRRRAEHFIERLRGAGIQSEIVQDSFRDYTVKVAISSGDDDCGRASLYYSPKANSFSLKTRELKDKAVASRLEACWHEEDSRKERPRDEAPRKGYD